MLRRGVVDRNVKIRLAFFRPASGLTPELVKLYGANVLSVTRQLRYEPSSTKTIDLGLFVNGVPVATAELKNPLTGQGWSTRSCSTGRIGIRRTGLCRGWGWCISRLIRPRCL